jgi:hypothetical protein
MPDYPIDIPDAAREVKANHPTRPPAGITSNVTLTRSDMIKFADRLPSFFAGCGPAWGPNALKMWEKPHGGDGKNAPATRTPDCIPLESLCRRRADGLVLERHSVLGWSSLR